MLTATVFAIRWYAIERPGPSAKELFPYGEMRVGVDASFPPFSVATADDLFGLDIDLGLALGAKLKVPVRFLNLGYDGLYDSLKTDQVDMLISALLIDPSRTNEVLYTLPYYNAGLALVTPADSPLRAMPEMSGHSLAFEFGSQADLTARQWLRRIAPFTAQPYERPDDALDATRLRLSDAALVDSTSIRLYLRAHPDWDAHYTQVTDVLYAIAIRIDRGRTWGAVNDALHSLVDDGSLEDMINRWL
jgi:polar amino acid transport system substrate-binding protein